MHVSDKFNQNCSLMNPTNENLLGTEIRMINDRLWNKFVCHISVPLSKHLIRQPRFIPPCNLSSNNLLLGQNFLIYDKSISCGKTQHLFRRTWNPHKLCEILEIPWNFIYVRSYSASNVPKYHMLYLLRS